MLARTRMCTHTHTHTQACMHAHSHTHTYTHTRTHMEAERSVGAKILTMREAEFWRKAKIRKSGWEMAALLVF